MRATGQDLIGMGRAQGIALGGAGVLTELLRSKRVHGRLEQAWARAVLKAKSLDAVFGKAWGLQ